MTGFEWDEDKRQRNIDERGVDFRLAALIFANRVLESDDQRNDYGERRIAPSAMSATIAIWWSTHGAETTAALSARRR
jgi:uncharacterized DUF497 family protein